jgi:hypothetical protein
MEERRTSARRLTIKDGKAILSSSTLMNCVIRNLGEGGALLEFGGPTQLPPEFRLRSVSARTEAAVELVWQHGYSAGVSFETPLC